MRSNEMKGKRIRFVVSFLTALGTFLLLSHINLTPRAGGEENQCFTCHTSARKLIKITREIESLKKAKPVATVKSEGEG